ncbi:hypothetical protein ACIA98_31920 [Streptomyces sp. NPDC051366]|uniref:hypothetical protein n=1 Tax=Streptomyces sp. NPDC051366 TaxID=3365652 RepID=UPI00379A57EF
MSIEKQVSAARQQLTGESLRGARLRIKELPTWSSPIPGAADTQKLLESLFLQQIGVLQTSSRYPLGIAEVIPAAHRLEVRFEHPAVVRSALGMLPYRDRQRSVHGVPGLWARTVNGTIEIAFARRPDQGVLALASRERSDLVELLAEYQSSLTEERCTPLWTVDPSSLPPEKFQVSSRRRKPKPPTLIDSHRSGACLPSAILRRIRLWDRLAGHASLSITAENSERGLDWRIKRELHPGFPIHDDRLAALLLEPVAGPGLVTDLSSHHCADDLCIMEFAAPADRVNGWGGILRLESTTSSNPAPLAPGRARHFTSLSEDPFPSHGDIVKSSRRAHSPLGWTRTDGANGAQAQGQCTQILAPRFSRSRWELQDIAMRIGAAWALDGYKVLVAAHSFDASQGLRRLRNHSELDWPATDRPTIATSPPWRKARLVPDNGSLFSCTASEYRKELGTLLEEARTHFDWVIFVDCNDNHGMGPYVEESADSYVIVVDDSGYEETLVTAESRNGVAQHREVPVSPAESAMAWRHQHLAGLPLDRVPVAGLVMQQTANTTTRQSPSFISDVDAQLRRLGTPVLARLPLGQGPALNMSSRTVLDDVDDEYRTEYLKACTSIRTVIAEAEPCRIPPPVSPWD